ncbi:uncharacterized protein LOC135491515 isoform X2 [Lineus longissimus]|uniref:uncharacterized protein LOC135491515 isoform X2 n=1 Tax=Lineus longissimus TaxID=88925 RepID=UPI002B4D28FA
MIGYKPKTMATVGVKVKVGSRRISSTRVRYRPPKEKQSNKGPGYKLNFVDFVPKCVEPEGLFNSPKYERFDILVERANQWLSEHTNVQVKTCETIEVKSKQTCHHVDSNKSTYYEQPGRQRTQFVRALRLWVGPHFGPPETHRIRYFNAMPYMTDDDVLEKPIFESFRQTIERVNDILRKNPLHGKIVTVETQEMKYKEFSNGLDPDKSYSAEGNKCVEYFLVCIRIFYVSGAPTYEEIGCADFVPQYLESGYETFQSVLNRASLWLRQQHSIRLTNIQSMNYKAKSGEPLDTQRSFYSFNAGNGWGKGTKYLRILRVCYTKPSALEVVINRPHPVITYKTFFPAQITKSGPFSPPKFETQQECMHRIQTWLSLTDVDVISAETLAVRMLSGGQYGNDEQMFTWDTGTDETWLFVLRVYLSGYYIEPSPSDLPALPVPKHEQEECCTIV